MFSLIRWPRSSVTTLEPIFFELRQSAMAPCNESSTLPLLTMGENISLDETTQDTVQGEHLGFDTVPTIVTVEEPSQVSEGKSDSVP